MTTNRNNLFYAAAVAASLLTAGAASIAFAADPVPAVEAPAVANPPATSAPATAGKLLGLTEIESRLTAQGIRVKEMEVHDKVLEVDGFDAQGREIDLIVDRRNGEILSRKFDN